MATTELFDTFIVVGAEEAMKLDQNQALSIDAFEDKRMQYICLFKEARAATELALAARTRAAVQAASEPTTWYVLQATFHAGQFLEMVTADASPRVEWSKNLKRFELYGTINFSDLASFSWSEITLGPVGEGQLLRHTRVDSLEKADYQGLTALHSAAYLGHLPLVEALLDQDLPQRVKLQDNFGDTPLHLAVARSNASAVQALLRHESYAPHVDLRAKSGKSVLHVAASKSCPAIIEALLQHPEIDPGPRDAHGHTPVHWAAWRGNKEAVSMLLEDERVRATVGRRSVEGKTAADIAEEKGHPRLAAMLRDVPQP